MGRTTISSEARPLGQKASVKDELRAPSMEADMSYFPLKPENRTRDPES